MSCRDERQSTPTANGNSQSEQRSRFTNLAKVGRWLWLLRRGVCEAVGGLETSGPGGNTEEEEETAGRRQKNAAHGRRQQNLATGVVVFEKRTAEPKPENKLLALARWVARSLLPGRGCTFRMMAHNYMSHVIVEATNKYNEPK